MRPSYMKAPKVKLLDEETKALVREAVVQQERSRECVVPFKPAPTAPVNHGGQYVVWPCDSSGLKVLRNTRTPIGNPTGYRTTGEITSFKMIRKLGEEADRRKIAPHGFVICRKTSGGLVVLSGLHYDTPAIWAAKKRERDAFEAAAKEKEAREKAEAEEAKAKKAQKNTPKVFTDMEMTGQAVLA